MILVTLNEIEQRLARALAEKRFEYDRQHGAQATIYNGTDARKNELDSIGAEIAYCKITNCYPDLDTEHFGSFDAISKTGSMVDVKQTNRPNGRLLIKMKDRASIPDVYALMIGEFPSYRLAGHISAQEAIKPDNIDHSLSHPAYAINQSQLSFNLQG